jgi:hypothetical protein
MAISRGKNILVPDQVVLPTLHAGQVSAWQQPGRFQALRCGRRWGKTEFLKTVASDTALKGRSFGWFTPEYKFQSEVYYELEETLYPVIKHASKNDGVIRTITGGRVDFWTLNNPKAGRSRKYHGVGLDEVAFAGKDMTDIWNKSIRPTLLDYTGFAIAASTPNGDDPENFFWQCFNDPKLGFVAFHAPTSSNPLLPVAEIAKLKEENLPLVYRQEYLAEFVDWSGEAFFSQESLLDSGVAPEWPTNPDAVYAVIDTAVKGGKEHDGLAVAYFALQHRHDDTKLFVLDWEISHIEGSLLEAWIPQVYERLEFMAKSTKAIYGSLGTLIEDKAAGSILIQQCIRRGMAAQAIDSKLTAHGKDERGVSVSGYVFRGMVKVTRPAFEKTVTYKGATRNHFMAQVCGYRVGVKDQDDDLYDTFCYGISIGIGNSRGF